MPPGRKREPIVYRMSPGRKLSGVGITQPVRSANLLCECMRPANTSLDGCSDIPWFVYSSTCVIQRFVENAQLITSPGYARAITGGTWNLTPLLLLIIRSLVSAF